MEPAEVARYFGVASSTVRQWVAAGKFRAAMLPTGHMRILARDVVKSLLQEGLSVPAELCTLASKHVLIVDPDHKAANSLAAAIHELSGCKVTVAATALDAKGLLNGARPDLVLLGVRNQAPSIHRSGDSEMLILAVTDDGSGGTDGSWCASFRVSDMLPSGSDERLVVSHVASVLLG